MSIALKNDECLMCFEDSRNDKSLMQYLLFPLLCGGCLKAFCFKPSLKFYLGVPVVTLFEFSEEASRFLIRYKDFFDVALASVFSNLLKRVIQLFFSEFKCIPIPSSTKNLKNRGFSHLNLMLEEADLQYIDCLRKTKDLEQRSLSYAERQKIRLKLTKPFKADQALIFDDVITSGASVCAAIEVLKPKANTLCVLVLFAGSDYLRERSFQL